VLIIKGDIARCILDLVSIRTNSLAEMADVDIVSADDSSTWTMAGTKKRKQIDRIIDDTAHVV